MIFERLKFRIDPVKLREHFYENIFKLPSVGLPTMFGGWSVLSSDGTYQDGWYKGHVDKDESGLTPEQQRAAFAKNPPRQKTSRDYNRPTEICTGYLREVVAKIADAKLYPSRARIIRLCANTTTFKHRDHTDQGYVVRLHLPIVTNESCFFETEDEKAHLPADGSLYLIHVNRIHWATNNGTTDRFHLVIDVRDVDGVTEFHRYDRGRYPDSPDLENKLPGPIVL